MYISDPPNEQTKCSASNTITMKRKWKKKNLKKYEMKMKTANKIEHHDA